MHLKSSLNENNSLAKNKHVQLNGQQVVVNRGNEEEEKKRIVGMPKAMKTKIRPNTRSRPALEAKRNSNYTTSMSRKSISIKFAFNIYCFIGEIV